MAYDLQADLAEAKRLTTLQNGDQYATPTPAPTRYTGATPAITNPVQNIAPLSTPTAPNTPTSPTMGIVDENAIRESTRQRMQSSIDAINANYANLISQEKVQGQDRSGQTRAINARSGTLGSDFGSAQQQKTTQFNSSQEKALVDQQAAQINAVMNNIEDRASIEIQSKRTEALGKYKIDMDEYKKNQEMARADLKSLAGSGVDLNTLNPAQKAALFKQAGYEGDMGELVYNAMKPKPKQIDYKYEKLADGKGMFWGVDPQTGELKRLEIDIALPPEWDMTVTPDGSIIGFDKNSGETRMLSSQGQFAKPESPSNNQKIVNIDGVDYVQNEDGSFTKPSLPQTPANPQALSQVKSGIDTINSLLNNKTLSSVVGATGGRATGGFWSNLLRPGGPDMSKYTGAQADFIASVENLIGKQVIDNLATAKQRGATFGALSQSELDLLKISASKINNWAIKKDDKVIGYDISEKAFKTELDKINNFAKADYILKGGGVTDVGAQTMQDGSVWAKNADGSMVKILDQLPQQQTPQNFIGPSFNKAGNASDSKQVKGTQESVSKLSPIDPNTFKPISSKFLEPTISTLTGNSKALATSVIQKYKPGSIGPGKGEYEGQCGVFVRDAVKSHGLNYPLLGDSLNSKIQAVKSHGTTIANARLGSVIVTKENPTYGHVAWIIGKNEKGFIVAESNFKQSKKVSYGRVIPFNSSKIIGVINPTKS